MADVVDLTQERETPTEALVEASRRPQGPQAIGYCHSCYERVSHGYRWCDTDCWADWDKVERAEIRAGKRVA